SRRLRETARTAPPVMGALGYPSTCNDHPLALLTSILVLRIAGRFIGVTNIRILQLRKLRQTRNLPLAEMGTLIGATKGFLSQVENGTKGISIPTLLKISSVLNT